MFHWYLAFYQEVDWGLAGVDTVILFLSTVFLAEETWPILTVLLKLFWQWA